MKKINDSRRKVLITLVWALSILCSGSAFSQNLLNNSSKEASDVFLQDFKKLLTEAESFMLSRRYSKADSTASVLLKRADKAGARYYQARAYLIKGKAFMALNDDVNAYVNLLNASKIFSVLEDYEYMSRTELEKGILFNRAHLWQKAYESFSLADSLYKLVPFGIDRVKLYGNFGKAAFNLKKYDDALFYYGLCRKYSVIYQRWREQVESNRMIALTYREKGDYENAIQYDLELVKISRRKNDSSFASFLFLLAEDYFAAGKYDNAAGSYKLLIDNTLTSDSILALSYVRLSELELKKKNGVAAVGYLNRAWSQCNDENMKVRIINKLTELFLEENEMKKASRYNEMALESVNKLSYENKLKTYAMAERIAIKNKDYQRALIFSEKSAGISDSLLRASSEEKENLAALSRRLDNYESLKKYEFVKENLRKMQLEKQRLIAEAHSKEMQLLKAERAAEKAEKENLKLRLQKLRNEADIYRQQLLVKEKENEIASMLRRDTISKLVIARDSIRRLNHSRELQAAKAEKQLAEMRSEKLKRRTFYMAVILLLVILSLLAFIRSLRLAKKSNLILQQKNEELERERAKLEEAMQKLKNAQQQLIESERLASLGQISAGIAHEIRNPLNFVNNFALLIKQYSAELEELLGEIKGGATAKKREEIEELTALLKENSDRIIEHGSRAARIIKRMLETARAGHAVKESTDLNLLLQDSAMLAYQGVRGEYPSFIATLNFELDKNIGKLMLVAQDLGRVFINLVNNACHALMEKKEKSGDFEARIDIKTSKKDGKVIIEIADNGIGMSSRVKEKLFTPFFTTKPAGKGTGLGLTMSYEIVKNIHGGEIKVESVENEFTIFVIELPIS